MESGEEMTPRNLNLVDVFGLQGQSNLLIKAAKELKAGSVEGRPNTYLVQYLERVREVERMVERILDGSYVE